MDQIDIAVIGAGPAGLAAAQVLCARGRRPVLFDRMPSVARKLLMAGKSGLNLTKAEPPDRFLAAYGPTGAPLGPMLAAFGPAELQAWAADLGEPLFTGTSGRVFPVAMKASPLLRRWLGRLGDVALRTRWRWQGWDGDLLAFDTPDGPARVSARATVLALGGASWSRLGSDGAWAGWIGVPLDPFAPANMGFDVAWSPGFAARYAGEPLKGARLSAGDQTSRAECVVTARGIEGGAIYALGPALRAGAALVLDLTPDRSEAALAARLARPRGGDSLSNHLRKSVGLTGLRAGLLRELAPQVLADLGADPQATARAIKALTLPLGPARPLDEAISTAGGVAWAAVDDRLMLHARPGVFVAGEMLAWEAPTGGYLLTACLATGRWAGAAAADWLARPTEASAPHP